MAHPFHHALSSAKKWGGEPEDYLLLHQFMDQSKAVEADFRHRAALHHSFGIHMLEQHFGPVITISTGRTVPVRFIGEQHVIQDLGRIPTLSDWTRCIRPEPWMGRAASASRGRSLRACPCLRRIMTMFAAYLRLHLPVDASWRAVVRAAASRLAPHSRRDASKRQARRDFYRTMIAHHTKAQSLVREYRL